MPFYRYEALSPTGRLTRGTQEADSAAAAREALRDRKLYPTRVEEERSDPAGAGRGGLHFGRRVQLGALVNATTQLGVLLRSGMPLTRCLEALGEQSEDRRLRKVLAQVRDQVSQGSSLSDALAMHPDFDGLYVNLVRAGESTGNLERSLEGLGKMLTTRQRLRRRIWGALAYPILMSLVGGGLLVVMLTFVLPQVVQLFDDTDQILPWPTRLLLGTADLLRNHWLGIALLAGFLVAGGILALRNEGVRLRVDGWKLRLPLFGGLLKKAATARIAGALGVLLRGGVPLLEALRASSGVAGNKVLEALLKESAERVRVGSPLAEPLSSGGLLPPVAIHMVRVGEESGSLDEMLLYVAELFEEEVETTVSALSSLLEPLMILVMGAIVGFMVLAILLPILSLNQGFTG